MSYFGYRGRWEAYKCLNGRKKQDFEGYLSNGYKKPSKYPAIILGIGEPERK